MMGGRLDLVVQEMAAAVDRLAADRRFKATARLVEDDVEVRRRADAGSRTERSAH